MSFQGKDSYTEIAQLIGRLVRTPLAQRVDSGDDRLNEVVAYLPGFKTEHVTRVVSALTEDETVQVEVLVAPEICERSREIPSTIFDLLDSVPSYERPRATFSTRTAQLMRLAAALNEHGLVANASTKAKQWIVDQLRAADTQEQEEVDAKVQDIQTLSVATLTIGMGAQLTTSTDTADADTAERDLDSYFVRAQRVLPDGSASWYFSDLCDRGVDEVEAGVRLAAMAALGFKDVIERQAAQQIKAWRDAHASAVARKPRNVRDQIEPPWYLGSSPMHPTTVEARQTYPAATEKIVGDETRPVPTFGKHLYVIPPGKRDAGLFPVGTSRSTWEADVLEKELGADTLVGWYRNPNSGRHALAVPYKFGDKTLLMHPDFLFLHQDGDEIVMDVIDPHRHDLADAAPKWTSLAQYAQDHADRVRRVLAVIRTTAGELRALDLTADGIAEKVAAATNRDSMEALFASDGFSY